MRRESVIRWLVDKSPMKLDAVGRDSFAGRDAATYRA
jgi:hypothetical protein